MKIEQKKTKSKNGDLYIYHMSLYQVDACRHYGGEYDDLSATGGRLNQTILEINDGDHFSVDIYFDIL